MQLLFSAIFGYLFGCIQASYIVGKIIMKKDIRELGNGNAGASNATVVFGPKFGAITALVDILKGVISLLVIRTLFKGNVSESELLSFLYINGLFVILGHNFPFYMGFRGGKGTAALVGVLLALDFWVGLLAVVSFIIVVLITDYIVVGTMSLLVVLLGNSLIFHRTLIVLISVLIIIVMSVYKHRLNFVNIKKGREKSVRAALFKKQPN